MHSVLKISIVSALYIATSAFAAESAENQGSLIKPKLGPGQKVPSTQVEFHPQPVFPTAQYVQNKSKTVAMPQKPSISCQISERQLNREIGVLQEKLKGIEAENTRLKQLVAEKNAALDKAIEHMSKTIGIKPMEIAVTRTYVKPPIMGNRQYRADSRNPELPPQRRMNRTSRPIVDADQSDVAQLLDAQGWENANFAGIGPVMAKYSPVKTYLKIPETKVVQAVDVFRRGVISSFPTKDGHIGFILDNTALVIR